MVSVHTIVLVAGALSSVEEEVEWVPRRGLRQSSWLPAGWTRLPYLLHAGIGASQEASEACSPRPSSNHDSGDCIYEPILKRRVGARQMVVASAPQREYYGRQRPGLLPDDEAREDSWWPNGEAKQTPTVPLTYLVTRDHGQASRRGRGVLIGALGSVPGSVQGVPY